MFFLPPPLYQALSDKDCLHGLHIAILLKKKDNNKLRLVTTAKPFLKKKKNDLLNIC